MLGLCARRHGTHRLRCAARCGLPLRAATPRSRTLCAAASAQQPVGLGCSSEEICGVGRDRLFSSMMNQIDAPARFLPVSSVSVRPAEGEAFHDGALWRSMVFNGPGPLHGSTIREHIYANPREGEIRFVALAPDGSEGELEVVSALLRKPMRIEYYQRHRETFERVHWDAPLSTAMRAVETVTALAKAKEAEVLDPHFVGTKS